MLHHKFYQNQLIQKRPRQKIGAFLCNTFKQASNKKQMQQLKHKQFTMWNEQVSLSIRYCHVPAGSGVTTIGKNNSDKKRPWIER